MAQGRSDLSGTNQLLAKAKVEDVVLKLPSRAKGLAIRANFSRKKILLLARVTAGQALEHDEAEFLDLLQELSLSLSTDGVLTIGKIKRPVWGLGEVYKQFGIEKPASEAELSQAKFLASLNAEAFQEKAPEEGEATKKENPYL